MPWSEGKYTYWAEGEYEFKVIFEGEITDTYGTLPHPWNSVIIELIPKPIFIPASVKISELFSLSVTRLTISDSRFGEPILSFGISS
ncbi:hypothetical protein [Methanosarcina acetivorans]|uniref:hypothetical protein n=1 Tax=Methanosarcina acetivorans TaxID=2214 RepID=UPI0012FF0527|nr:hypothetical protein [Methanosarcina acetivorans]